MPEGGVNTEGASLGKSSFASLKKWGERIAHKFRQTPTPKTEVEGKPTVVPKVEIPQDSGLKQLADSFKDDVNFLSTPQAIEELLGDFYSYLETLDPQTKEKAMRALIDGDEDVVGTLAYIKLEDYKKAIQDRRNLKPEDSAQNGFKKLMAEKLVQAMDHRIKIKYERDPIGSLMDLKFVLSNQAPAILSNSRTRTSSTELAASNVVKPARAPELAGIK